MTKMKYEQILYYLIFGAVLLASPGCNIKKENNAEMM